MPKTYTISKVNSVGVKKYHVDPFQLIFLTRMLILEQNATMISMCIAAATYRLDCRQPVQATLPPTHLAIAPAELHHGSSEFLELDIFPAYSMQFDYIP